MVVLKITRPSRNLEFTIVSLKPYNFCSRNFYLSRCPRDCSKKKKRMFPNFSLPKDFSIEKRMKRTSAILIQMTMYLKLIEIERGHLQGPFLLIKLINGERIIYVYVNLYTRPFLEYYSKTITTCDAREGSREVEIARRYVCKYGIFEL